MGKLGLCLVIVSAASLCACEDDPGEVAAPGTGSDAAEMCQTLCEKGNELGCSTAAVDCDAAACEQGDIESLAPWCEEAIAAVTACASEQPSASYECSEGEAKLREGVCDAETQALTACLFDGPAEGLPALDDECEAICQAQSGLSCADPSCASQCGGMVAPSQACAGAAASLVLCASKLPASSWSCSEQGRPSLDIDLDADPDHPCAPAFGLVLACGLSQGVGGGPSEPPPGP